MNTCARLQAAAPPGGVLVGEATHRVTERKIEYREAGPIEAKGKAEPVKAWLAVAPRSRTCPTSAAINVDFPAPGGPVTPITAAFPVSG
ncbi:MAG: hypothetical protein A2Y55_06480 [Actinobacteria bacterium RBG_16_68_12]|nr:MAG: hypothetical protein A2Y55_06480 [Actinobacteria bacterium RBG_16_68_12]